MEICCDFRTVSGLYICRVRKVKITQRREVKSFKKEYDDGKSNEDVEVLEFRSTTVNFLPSGLHKIFPQLKKLYVCDCSLKEIASQDLERLENLEGLWLVDNKLKSLPNDLLIHTKKLKWIKFDGNQLECMSSRLLEPIPDKQWNWIGLQKNARIDQFYGPSGLGSLESVEELKIAIDSSCLPPHIQLPANVVGIVNNYKKLWELKTFTDFTIVVGSKYFQVHKCVLAVQSSVFAKKLQNDKQVKATNKFVIEDFHEAIVEEFLRSLYTGEVKNRENALKLFSLACIFKVEELRSIYEKIIIQNVNKMNAAEVMEIGKIYNSNEIIEASWAEIEENAAE